MVSSLPQSVRLRLEQTLAQWRHWTPAPDKQPLVLEVFADGLSNTSVRVGAGSRDWVVRIDGIAPAKIGLNRSAEWRALRLAAVAGLSPLPVYQNPQLGVLVTRFHPPDAAPPENRRDLLATAELLRSIHAMPRLKFRLDPLDRARRYLHLLGTDRPPEGLVRACERLAQGAPEPVLCHNDLLRANRLWSAGTVMALDWGHQSDYTLWADWRSLSRNDPLMFYGTAGIAELVVARIWTRSFLDVEESREVAAVRALAQLPYAHPGRGFPRAFFCRRTP
jgi:thiamine kinase